MPALGNKKRFVSDPTPAVPESDEVVNEFRERRSGRYRMRSELSKLLANTSIARCGHRPIPGNDTVQLRCNDTGAYFTGAQMCGNPWLCPVCGAKIAMRRGKKVDAVTKAVADAGGSAALLTLTAPHSPVSDPKVLVKLNSKAMGKLLAGRAWHGDSKKEADRKRAAGKPVNEGLKGRLGYLGQIRIMEISHGRHGFHPHVHAALYFDRPLTQIELLELEVFLFKRWKRHVQQATGRAPSWEHGIDLRPWHNHTDGSTTAAATGPGWYLTKVAHGWSIGSELAAGIEKTAKGQSLNPAQLVSKWVRTKDKRTGRLIKQLHDATQGVHMSYTSPALNKLLPDADATDEELAEGEDQDGDLIAELDGDVFAWARRLDALADILTAAETGHIDDVVEALTDYGLPVRYRPEHNRICFTRRPHHGNRQREAPTHPVSAKAVAQHG